ncbi:hypothetical protein ALC56_10542 [Trachymyrmex septentrionalis]|uniref:Uncharacterized protein n=1 Tax=Trachymyrmex septentrionalis TaxID=34720 RepID=A0A151JU75_9HYME|nr:hypothetical protein ALC56_10542 [Trachymyrmex septentrionalis]
MDQVKEYIRRKSIARGISLREKARYWECPVETAKKFFVLFFQKALLAMFEPSIAFKRCRMRKKNVIKYEKKTRCNKM